MSLELTLSYWVDANHVKATTLLRRNGIDAWFDYYPDEAHMHLSYYEIRDAFYAGTLTGAGKTPVERERPSLEQQKFEKLYQIEMTTKQIQSNGYTVQVNGVDYVWDTLGERADRNWIWLAILSILVLVGILPTSAFRGSVTTKDDTVVVLASAAAAIQFILTLKLTEQAVLDAGAALRKAVNDATTQEELDAVVDTRMGG